MRSSSTLKSPFRDPDNCAYRHAPGRGADPGAAECRLLKEISGVDDGGLCRVSRDACACCCRSAHPGPDRINPVLASLLYALADRVIGAGGVAGCDLDEAGRLREWAEGLLDSDPAEVDTTHVPERALAPCSYLGEAEGGGVEPAAEEAGGEAVYTCRHPDHGRTTPTGCLLCRDWTRRPGREPPPVGRLLPVAARLGEPVLSWSVGVATAPRRRPTLEWTLDSLARAGWPRARLFVDGSASIPRRHAHLPVTLRDPKVGAWPNFYLALAELLMRDPDADAYLMVQDDVEFHDRDDLRGYLEGFLWPTDPPGPVSLFSSQAVMQPRHAWSPQQTRWFLGAQAFIFPRAAAREFVADRNVVGHRWNRHNQGLANIDTVVGFWAYQRGTPIYSPTPSLCRHVGHTSTLWPGARVDGNRREGPFAGDLPAPVGEGGGQGRGSFPEDLFPCPPEMAGEYARAVERGRARMRQQSAVICGIGRDVRHGLEEVVARIERLGRMFRDYRVVLYENDSTDGTLPFLKVWAAANPAVVVLGESRGHPRYPSIRSLERAARLADYRNEYHREVVERFGAFDLAVVVDMDLAGGWSFDGIAHTFGHDGWDFVGSNGLVLAGGGPPDPARLIHYDTWAFRGVGNAGPHPDPAARTLRPRRGEPLMPVWSCFGGLGVYRMGAFKAAAYEGGDCEHVRFHRRMRALGHDRLFLNPSQVVLYHDLSPWA